MSDPKAPSFLWHKLTQSKFIVTLFLSGLLSGGLVRAAETMLFDFGAAGSQTTGGVPPAPIYWNNVTDGIGAVDGNVVPGLVTTNNTPTDIGILIVSRFNGSNDNGTQTGNTNYPVTATRDSLFGNTELFNNLENLTPIIKLTGLVPATTYTLTFYASRTGVTDNRETRYTVTGATEVTRDLNVANNITNQVIVTALAPDANSEITIALTPSTNNNNANHFVYLGVLKIETSTGDRLLVDFGVGGNQTIAGNEPPSPFWNNVTDTIGSADNGSVPGLVTTNGTDTAYTLQMVSRFNAANTAGATTSTLFPTSATSDSLFGNTEAFNALSNIRPVFKLTGLDPANVYNFTFYASRNGVSDNRETRYTVTGTNVVFGDLNASNNTNNTVTVSGLRPTEAGELTIALTPGPNNNNTANHFTYLGVMRVDYEVFREPQILIDFGADGRPTTPLLDPNGNTWNNVTAAIGAATNGGIANLNLTGGSPSGIGFAIISRFNGANENGTESNPTWPLDATRDSLFGNTELFGGLENITPIFKFTNLVVGRFYKLTLFASRLGVGDTRETRYIVKGSNTQTNDYVISNNETEVSVFESVFPDSNGEIRIELVPGPLNDNANHFVYLGVMQIDWSAVAVVQPKLSAPAYANGSFTFTITGVSGKTYKIQRTADFTGWSETGVTVTLSGTTGVATVPQTEAHYFYRVVEQ